MTSELVARVEADLDRDVHPAIAEYARVLAEEAGALAVLFYGSNLRTGSLDGVIDYYLLLPGRAERGLWPRVSYRESPWQDDVLHAKIATMTLEKFSEAARGETIDTTIWARFVQPAALIWSRDDSVHDAVVAAICDAVCTASRLAVAVGPPSGLQDEYWRALFRATYRAELRVEKPGREQAIIEPNAGHFDGLLSAGLREQNIAYRRNGASIEPLMPPYERAAVRRWWNLRRRLGKALNMVRLARATRTFEGAARYAAWKIERHTGIPVKLTERQERHPVLAAPRIAWVVMREKRRQSRDRPR